MQLKKKFLKNGQIYLGYIQISQSLFIIEARLSMAIHQNIYFDFFFGQTDDQFWYKLTWKF